MKKFEPVTLDLDQQDDLRAEVRASMFAALRTAFKRRSAEGMLAKDLANAVGRDAGYVSRILNGTSRTIEAETLVLFLEAMRFHLPIKPIAYEELEARKSSLLPEPIGIRDSEVASRHPERIFGRPVGVGKAFLDEVQDLDDTPVARAVAGRDQRMDRVGVVQDAETARDPRVDEQAVDPHAIPLGIGGEHSLSGKGGVDGLCRFAGRNSPCEKQGSRDAVNPFRLR